MSSNINIVFSNIIFHIINCVCIVEIVCNIIKCLLSQGWVKGRAFGYLIYIVFAEITVLISGEVVSSTISTILY